jgi:aerobic-type carbon monoxide dehydrogenase small subunit (CoxS/CutS family)
MQLEVNGTPREVDTAPARRLLDVLRESLGLPGSKYGCGEGQCGACTVLVDGSPRRSCMLRMVDVDGKRITTIEGLAGADGLHPLQQAFVEAGALQCGFCTAGMIMQAAGILAEEPNAGTSEIRRRLDGNICRCGTHPRVIEAVRLAASRMQEAGQ